MGGCCACVVQIPANGSGVVSVSDAETTIAAADPLRKNLVVQNHGTTTLQIHFVTGQAYGAGPIQLGAGETWNAAQAGVGVYRGIVYGIRDAGNTENAGFVIEQAT